MKSREDLINEAAENHAGKRYNKLVGSYVSESWQASFNDFKAGANWAFDKADQEIAKLKADLDYWVHRAADAESGDCDSRIFKELSPKITKLEADNKQLVEERDAYALAMKIALEDGIFPHKELTKNKIQQTLTTLQQRHGFLNEGGEV